MYHYDILVPLAFDNYFTYKFSEKIKPGSIVKVEFRNKELFSLLVKESDHIGISEEKIKSIIQVSKDIVFSKNTMDFINKMSEYNSVKKGLVLRAFLTTINADKVKSEKLKKSVLEQKVNLNNFDLPILSENQNKIYEAIKRDLTLGKVSLIDGVTGSGKTEIFFHLISNLLREEGTQMLILLPEIALTNQILSRFEKSFNFKPALWHSKISKKNKREIYNGIISGEVRVIIGARSALLLPFNNIKLIVVDEEHDNSYKQDEIFNFHARDMAILMSKIFNFSVILSSATPSIESYQNALDKKYTYYSIKNKFNNQISRINIVDMTRENIQKNEFIGNFLKKAIIENFKNNKQTLLFLNRRGYAPVILCKKCGHRESCPNCSANLVGYKSFVKFKDDMKKDDLGSVLRSNFELLICHYCGFEKKISDSCASCNERDSFIDIGAGVEKIKDEVAKFLPSAKVELVTSDTIKNFDEANNLINKINNQEVNIIVGTQLIAKGYDFDNLNLVGVIDADSSLYSYNFRANEYSYQILKQVIGRAGRRQEDGNVVIQTYNPENKIFKYIRDDNQKGFYDDEISNRKKFQFPPFSRMILFSVSSRHEKTALSYISEIVKKIPFHTKIEILGPTKAPLFKIKNRYEYRVYISANKNINVQKLINDVISKTKKNLDIEYKIDVDNL